MTHTNPADEAFERWWSYHWSDMNPTKLEKVAAKEAWQAALTQAAAIAKKYDALNVELEIRRMVDGK